MIQVRTKRHGISLMEVLISIGVISLGIFGVASLIPVAQFKVAEGTALDRISAFGPSAAAEFRIRNMGSPETWESGLISPLMPATVQSSDASTVVRRGYVIDPLGVIQGKTWVFPVSQSIQDSPWLMPRMNLATMPALNGSPGFVSLQASERVAQRIFYLADDVSFDRPTDQGQSARRQYFTNGSGEPIATVPGAQFSWFATLSPTVAHMNSDEFALSLVICKNRTPEESLISQSEWDIPVGGVQFSGELTVANSAAVPELTPGDWILVAKSANMNDSTSWLYRWTQVVGISDKEVDDIAGTRTISIANDDFIGPGEVNTSQNKAARIFFVKGVESVFERTIRIQNTSAWDEF